MADNLTDERDCNRMLDDLQAALRDALIDHTPLDDGPRFTDVLQVSALLRLASELIGEAVERNPDDRMRYLAMVQEVARRSAVPGPEVTH